LTIHICKRPKPRYKRFVLQIRAVRAYGLMPEG